MALEEDVRGELQATPARKAPSGVVNEVPVWPACAGRRRQTRVVRDPVPESVQCLSHLPQHFLYFIPELHGHGAFRPSFTECVGSMNTGRP